MNRTRLPVLVVVVCALLAAAALGAAAVFGALSLRPLGFVSIAAAMVNIGIISSPQTRTGQRVAGVLGAVTIVAAVIMAVWGFGQDTDWWLPTLLLVGAVLMIPAVALNWWQTTRMGSAEAEAEDEPTAVSLQVGSAATPTADPAADSPALAAPSGPTPASAPSAVSPDKDAAALLLPEDTTEDGPDTLEPADSVSASENEMAPAWSVSPEPEAVAESGPAPQDIDSSVATPDHAVVDESAPEPEPEEPAPRRGRRAIEPLPWDDDDDDDEDWEMPKPRRGI